MAGQELRRKRKLIMTKYQKYKVSKLKYEKTEKYRAYRRAYMKAYRAKKRLEKTK